MKDAKPGSGDAASPAEKPAGDAAGPAPAEGAAAPTEGAAAPAAGEQPAKESSKHSSGLAGKISHGASKKVFSDDE